MMTPAEWLKGKAFKTRLLNPYDEFCDRRLGVRTFGFRAGCGGPGDSDWQVHYVPTAYRDILRNLRFINLNSDDVFVDLGCGLGRAVFVASWLGAKGSVGVEINEDLCNQARTNYRRSNLAKRDIEFFCMNAKQFKSSDVTVLYMFHPFGETTLRQVLRNIEEGLAESPRRRLRIVYFNPVFENVLHEMSWLKPIGKIPKISSWPSTIEHYATSFWQTVSS
jgi:SAM-dependent methyltransferase